MPFLLDLMRIPADLFQLFMLAGIFCGRFGGLLNAMHLLCLTLITVCSLTGFFAMNRKRVLLYLTTALALLLLFAF